MATVYMSIQNDWVDFLDSISFKCDGKLVFITILFLYLLISLFRMKWY